MKRYKIAVILMITVSMIPLYACSNKSGEAKPAAVAVEENKKVVEASGVVKALNVESIVIDMPAEASPKVLKFDVQNGQRVKKGDKLAELDISDYNALVLEKSKAIEADEALRKDMQTYNEKKAQDLKIDGEQAELDALKAKVDKSYIKNSNIISDMDNAVVTDIGYNPGDVVNLQQKIMTLQDLNSLVIIADIDEEFIKDFKEGNAVTIIPKYDPSAKLTGKVSRIFNEAVEQNGDTFINVEISIDKNDGKLLPNYNVDVEINKN